jgi:hypothetical protein
MNTRTLPFLALLGVLFAMPASAQDLDDSRWLPWVGCWETADATSETLMCVQPAEGGVELVAIAEDGPATVEALVADGRGQPLETDQCEGARFAEFSADGERVYLREEIDCNGSREVVTGVIAMVSPTIWVDIRGAQDRPDVWGRTFRRATSERAAEAGFASAHLEEDLAARMMRWRASEPSNFDDVIEVYDRTGAGVTRAWVMEQLDPFAVNADALVRLADAGVSESVIDVMVATAFPEYFAFGDRSRLDRQRPVQTAGMSPAFIGGGFVGSRWGPWGGGFSPWGFGLDPWGFGFSPWGFGGGWGWGPRGIIVNRAGGFFGGGTVRQGNNGVRPLPGGGYTRRGGTSGTGSISRGTPARGGGASAPPRRTAKPRTGGGGGI